MLYNTFCKVARSRSAPLRGQQTYFELPDIQAKVMPMCDMTSLILQFVPGKYGNDKKSNRIKPVGVRRTCLSLPSLPEDVRLGKYASLLKHARCPP